MSVCVRDIEFVVVFTDCESCTRPISTHPGSIEAGDHGLTRGTRFTTCRIKVVAVAGLLWLSWCVFAVRADIIDLYSSNAHGLLQV